MLINVSKENIMKTALTLLALGLFISIASASEHDLDDLGTIPLNLEENASADYTVQYPGYRLGGGTPPTREITDCLILDIKDSDRILTTEIKLALAKRLKVLDGYREGSPLKPVIQGRNVVFRLISGSSYLTMLKVKTIDGKSLQSNINAALPRSEDVNNATPVGLVYVRACRF